MERSLRDRTKALVNSILLAYPKGLPLDRFLQEYNYQEKDGLQFKEMGFDSPLGLLTSLTDVVKCIKVPSGNVVLQAVSNKGNEHLHEMVSHQKNRNNKIVKKVSSLLKDQPHDILVKVEPKEEPIDRDDPFVWKEKTPRSMTSYQYEHFLCEMIIEILSMEQLSLTFDEIYDVFLNKFQHAIELSRLEYSSPKQFFEAHENIFSIQEQNGRIIISLQRSKQRPQWALTPIDVPITSIYLGARQKILKNVADPKNLKDPRLIRDPVLLFEQSDDVTSTETPVTEVGKATLPERRSSATRRSNSTGGKETNHSDNREKQRNSHSNRTNEPPSQHPAAPPTTDSRSLVQGRCDQPLYQPPPRSQSRVANSQPLRQPNKRDPRLKRNTNPSTDVNQFPGNIMNANRQEQQSNVPLHNLLAFQAPQNVVNVPGVYLQSPILQPRPLPPQSCVPLGNYQMPVPTLPNPLFPYTVLQNPVIPLLRNPGNQTFRQVPNLIQLHSNGQNQFANHQPNFLQAPGNPGSSQCAPPPTREDQRNDAQSTNAPSGRHSTSENPIWKKRLERSKLSNFGRKPSFVEPPDHYSLPATFGVVKPKQKDVWTSSVELKYQELPPEAAEPLEFFFVIVGEVYTPGKFYWFLKDNKRAIENLSDEMTVFYRVQSSVYDMKREEMFVGQIVAALYIDQLFYRARILSFQGKEGVEVFYIDYGSKSVIDPSHICHLHLQYTQLPVQGFCGRLFGILPPDDCTEWPDRSSRTFLDLVKDSKPLAASVFKKETVSCGKENETIYFLSLTDTTSERDLHIADYLFDEKLAKENKQEQKELEDILAAIAVSTGEGSSSSPALQPPLSPTESSLPGDILAQTPMEVDEVPDACTQRPTSMLMSTPVKQLNEPQTSSSFNRPTSPIFQTPSATPAVSPTESLRDSRPPSLRKRYIKPVGLSNGKTLHIFKMNNQLYLSGVEMASLIPAWGNESTMEESFKHINLSVDKDHLNIKSVPSILLECAKLDIPWLKQKGEFVETIQLYPLKIISSILFIFGKSDPELNRVLDSQLKALDDPYWG